MSDTSKIPADWKEAVKDRWFPEWLKRRFPVQTRDVLLVEKLSVQTIRRIEDQIQPGYCVELRQIDNRLDIQTWPAKKLDTEFDIRPVSVREDGPATIIVTAIGSMGDRPVILWQGQVPAHYWLTGIKGVVRE